MGFNNPNEIVWEEVNLVRLANFEGSEISPESLAAAGIIKKVVNPIKLLGVGDVSKAFTVRVHRATASARQKIEAAGGTVEELLPRAEKAETEIGSNGITLLPLIYHWARGASQLC